MSGHFFDNLYVIGVVFLSQHMKKLKVDRVVPVEMNFAEPLLTKESPLHLTGYTGIEKILEGCLRAMSKYPNNAFALKKDEYAMGQGIGVTHFEPIMCGSPDVFGMTCKFKLLPPNEDVMVEFIFNHETQKFDMTICLLSER